MYGWFSERAQRRCGSHVYATPDGRKVVVTHVTRGPDQASGWTDSVLVGEVTHWAGVALSRDLAQMTPWPDDDTDRARARTLAEV
jgi:hypothetical protein